MHCGLTFWYSSWVLGLDTLLISCRRTQLTQQMNLTCSSEAWLALPQTSMYQDGDDGPHEPMDGALLPVFVCAGSITSEFFMHLLTNTSRKSGWQNWITGGQQVCTFWKAAEGRYFDANWNTEAVDSKRQWMPIIYSLPKIHKTDVSLLTTASAMSSRTYQVSRYPIYRTHFTSCRIQVIYHSERTTSLSALMWDHFSPRSIMAWWTSPRSK